MAEIPSIRKSAIGATSAAAGRRHDSVYEGSAQDHHEFSDSAISGWLRNQQRAQTYALHPDGETASWRNHEDSSVGYRPAAAGGTGSWASQEKDSQPSGQAAEDELSSWDDQESADADGFLAEHEAGRAQPLRLAILYFVLMLLGVGSAVAWRTSPIQSTIGTAARTAMAWSASFVQPTAAAVTAPAPAKPQPSTADLAQQIGVLSSQIEALKQQINQLNAAQAQSAKSAAEQQLKVLALQQVLEQKTEAPAAKPPQVAAVARAAALPKPRPRAKPSQSRDGKPLRLGPSWTAQR